MFVVRPDAEFSTSDLCRGAYPRAGGVITDNQRRSVRGAAESGCGCRGRSRTGKGRPLFWRAK